MISTETLEPEATGLDELPYSRLSAPALEELFLSELVLIRRLARRCTRCFGLADLDAAEFVSSVELKLISDNYHVFRRFRGGSSLSTYLTMVIRNHCRDFMASRWGKWRPSRAARRLGPVAIELEMLTNRDGYSDGEAIETVRSRSRGEYSPDKVERLANRLPPRMPRGLALHRTAFEAWARPIDCIAHREFASTYHACRMELSRAVSRLGEDDRAILGLRFRNGLTVAGISVAMGTRQQPLYRRLSRILAKLRRDLERGGFRRDEVLGAIRALTEAEGEPVCQPAWGRAPGLERACIL